ncbi:MAG: zf-HC2 domain-containing protein [Vicinamibacteria bacterium]
MTDVACSSGVELLADYLEGVLPPETAAALEAHVAGCPACVPFLASYRATPQILRDATDAELPDEIGSSLMDFLKRERRSV